MYEEITINYIIDYIIQLLVINIIMHYDKHIIKEKDLPV